MTAGEPELDRRAIETLLAIDPEGGPEFLRELVVIFLADTPRRLAEIEQGAVSRDGVKLERAAHSLKGSAGAFGATRLAALAADMEAQGQAGEFAQARAGMSALYAEYERLQPAFEQLRQR